MNEEFLWAGELNFMGIRNIKEDDYVHIHAVINDWWGGRSMANMLPKLFFVHFQDTSFILERDGEMAGFLCGFLSQTYKEEAYVHFIGVNPKCRREGIAAAMYARFFEVAQQNKRSIVKAVTSPVNKTSIQFHTSIGFEVETGDEDIESVSVHTNYDGEGGSRVLFVKHL